MNKLLLVILAILLPPLAVFLKTNSGKTTLLNLVLCIFFWVPGILHALWVILK
ncbi:MAG: YqaE/Pmp3 family membrane protein [Limisphaerales bacterium]